MVWKEEDDIPSMTTLILRSERKLSNNLQSFGARPTEVSLARRFLCHIIWKALKMSKATARVSFPASRVLFQIWVTYARMSPVDRCCLKPNCLSWINLFESKCRRTCSLMAFIIGTRSIEKERMFRIILLSDNSWRISRWRSRKYSDVTSVLFNIKLWI